MKIYKLFLFGIVIFAFASCQKQPSANFITDYSEYVAGDMIKLTNTSTDAKKYFWTMPNGQTLTNKNIEYTTYENQSDGTLTFKLVALSRDEKKTSEISKTVDIKAATGQLTVWTSNATAGQIYITINGTAMGSITQSYTSEPACGAAGCVSVTLKTGSNTISATNGTLSWNGTMLVKKNGCATIELK